MSGVMSTPLARTPLHHWHAAHGARFEERDGWQLPAEYSGAESECAAARAGLALADLSAFVKIGLLGPGVSALARALAGDGPASRPRGVTRFRASGPVLACRLTANHLLLLTAATSPAALEQHLAGRTPDARVVQSDVTSAHAGFCLAGPHAEDALRRLTPLDLAPIVLPADSCAETSVAGVPALLVRTAELTVLSVRVYVSWDLAEYVWERLLDAGRCWKVVPLGSAGWQVLRADHS